MSAIAGDYSGFYSFAKLLEDVAKGIQNGAIEVPK
jgi:hypothetical protein